jgi:hypothetical protein
MIVGFLLFAFATIGSFIPLAHAENSEIAAKRASERLSFTDREIADGFFAVAFGAELQFGKREERIRKFAGPVRVFADNRSVPRRTEEIKAAVADIGLHIAHLDIAMTDDPEAANVIVTIVDERNFKRTLEERFGKQKAGKIAHSLKPVCLSGIAKDDTFRIQNAEVFLPGDVDDFTFTDCVYEELLQSLGPINDSAATPQTMFNDKVQMGFFDRYDQHLLNILYHPLIMPGMTKEQVKVILPSILPEVRERVTSLNSPGGQAY